MLIFRPAQGATPVTLARIASTANTAQRKAASAGFASETGAYKRRDCKDSGAAVTAARLTLERVEEI